MIKNGHIFRLDEEEAVIMTKDLEFYKVKRSPDMVILGQEVSFSKCDIIKPNFRKSGIIKYGALISSVAAVLVFIALSLIPLDTAKNNVYAYIDIDTNISLRLSINNESKVLGVNPINDSTRAIIDGLDLENKNIDDALWDIIKKSKEEGFTLSDSNEYMMISAALNSENKEYKLSKQAEEKKLHDLLNKVTLNISNSKDTKVYTAFMQVDPGISRLASEKNVSMARYVQYIKSKEKGFNITLDEVRKIPLTEIMEKADDDTSNPVPSDKIVSNEINTVANNNTALDGNDGSVDSTPTGYWHENNHLPNKPGVEGSGKRQLIRTIPMALISPISSNRAYATPSPEAAGQIQELPTIPAPGFKQRTIPPVVMTPVDTFIPQRTIKPFISPTPVSTPVVSNNTTPYEGSVPTTPTPVPTPTSNAVVTPQHAIKIN